MYGKAETVKLLLDAGADVTKQNSRGRTALALAEMEGNNSIIQLLKDAGAQE